MNTKINPWKRFLKLLQVEKRDISAIYFYAILSGILSMSLPLGIQSVIRFIQSGQITTSWIVLILLVVLGAILTGVMQIMQLRITENIQQRLFVHYSFDFAHRFPRFRMDKLGQRNPNELVNRFFDVMGLQKGFSKVLLDFTSALLQIVFSLFVLSLYHPFYIAFSILLVVLLFLIFKPFIRQGLETSLRESKHKYATAYWLQEISRGSWSLRTSPDEKLSLNRLDESASNYIKSREAHFRILLKQFVWTIAFKVLIIISLLGLGGYLVITQQINLGQFVAAEVLILLLLGAVEKIIQSMDNLYDVCASLEKLEQVKDIPMLFEEPHDESETEIFPIELVKVTSEVSGEPVLTINQKSDTFFIDDDNYRLDLVLKQCLEVHEMPGFVTRWNHKIPSCEELEAGYHKIGWFSSASTIIDETLLNNITLQRSSILKEDVLRVLEVLNIDYLCRESVEGLNTSMKRLKAQLTPQEIQKVLIARSIINYPNLLVISFIYSSFSLDEQKALLEKIKEFTPNTTIICGSTTPLFENWNIVNVNELSL